MLKSYLAVVICLFLSTVLPAQWGTTPADNLLLSEEQGNKFNKMALPAPEDGWYICYTNRVINDQSLHLVRVDPMGQTIWRKTLIDNDVPGNISAVMISDSLGGLILTWTDRRTENTALTYANRFDPEGNKLWGEEDVRVGVSEIEEFSIKMVTDGKHGAIITFYDDNPPSGDFRGIYAYRVRANGQVAWRTFLFPSGTLLRDYDMDQDSEGGLVAVTEYGHPTELENQIRAMRLDSTGAKIWPDETFDLGPISLPIGMQVKSSTRGHIYPNIIAHPGVGFYVVYFENPGILFPDEEINHRGHFLNMDGTQHWDPEGLPLNRPSNNSPDIQFLVDHEGNFYFNYHTDSDFELQKVTPAGTLPWGIHGVPYSAAFQGAPDNLLLTSCNDIIIGFDGGPEEIIEAIRINSMGQMVYTPDASIALSTNPIEVQDRDPITAINADDQVIAVWNRDEDIGDDNMDVYVQGFGKDGMLGNTINATHNLVENAPKVGPNPFSQHLRIHLQGLPQKHPISIFDGQGRLYWSNRSHQSDDTIDTTTWPQGLYVIRIGDQRQWMTRKVVKTAP